MAILVLEQTFETPVSPVALADSARRVDACLEVHGARWLRSFLSRDRKRMICIFEGADAEHIRDSYRSARVNFDSCWVSDEYAAEKPYVG